MKKRAKALISFIFVSVALFLFLAIDTSHAFLGKGIFYLPYTISSPGTYYVMKDLKCPPGSHGITIRADNVTLDLMGFSLIGPGGTGDYDGVHINNRKNVEIRNGTVRNFPKDGIWENCGFTLVITNHRIINVRVQGNGNSGIYLYGSGNFVHQCTAVGNADSGITALDGSTVTGNTCSGNGWHGIKTGAGVTVTGNTCFDNTRDGILANAGSTISGNTCFQNKDIGIYVGYGSTVTGNTCARNLVHGICCDGPAHTIIGNTCFENTDHGIYINPSMGNCLIDQNTSFNNGTNLIDSYGGCVYGINKY